MPTLNRFPLLGLWAEEAARRIGYTKAEAESLGHAYAVLYAIRAQRIAHPEAAKEKGPERTRRKPTGTQTLSFGGDELDVSKDSEGRVQGRVGGEAPQTSKSYLANIRKKFPAGYYARLQKAFRQLLRRYPPKELDSRLVYNLYDRWKRECGKGRLVDLDQLTEWCHERAENGAGEKRSGAKKRVGK
jgi:hypothetical protein